MLPTLGYAVKNSHAKFEPFQFSRRELKPHDVLIQILYCGICHSDIHQVRNEWNNSTYPMVPGHEIVGRVKQVGGKVSNIKINDPVGVGCFVDSCRQCINCQKGEEQFCENHVSLTYNGTEQDLTTPTFGGYSSQIVVDEKYVLKIAPHLELAAVAPLLCAGITTYSPLRRFKVGPGTKVAIVGLGGLGHMAVKFAKAMGSHVTVLSTSPSKEQDAHRLGAHDFVVTKDAKNFAKLANHFNFILDAVSAPHDINLYLNLLQSDGVCVLIGVPTTSFELQPFSLIIKRRILAGSLIGGLRENQEMLDYCAEHNITADIELVPIQQLEEAYERTIQANVRYRFVIDMSSLK